MTGDIRPDGRLGNALAGGSTDVVHFGEFTFYRSSGELVGPRETTRLAPQVAAVLQLLLARPGGVVPRAEFHERVWPDTTVEFDQGLNFCIRQLRLALSDDAGEPRYIETLPRRGYRLIVPVTDQELVEAQPGAARRTDAEPTLPPPRPASPRLSRRLVIAAAVVPIIATVAALAFGTGGTFRRGPRNTEALAVLAFDVDDADVALRPYRATLAEQLVTDLTAAGGGNLSVMGPSFTSRFPGMRTAPESLVATLSAGYVLSGALRTTTAGTRVFAQLIRLRDRKHVFASVQFDSVGTPARMSVIADSIARGVRGVMAAGARDAR